MLRKFHVFGSRISEIFTMNRIKSIILILIIVYTDLSAIDNSREPAVFCFSAAVLIAGTAYFAGAGPQESRCLQPLRVFCADKPAFHFHVKGAAGMSHLALAGSFAVPAASISGLRLSGDRKAAWTALVESHFIAQGAALFSKAAFHRPRPSAYDAPYRPEKRMDADSFHSFFSSHASMAFTNAMLAGLLLDGSHFQPGQKNRIWAAGMALAASTGVLRVAARRHFPTDVLAGAIAGCLSAGIVHRLHD
jgi:membrane-associated phospholipid phosphatase